MIGVAIFFGFCDGIMNVISHQACNFAWVNRDLILTINVLGISMEAITTFGIEMIYRIFFMRLLWQLYNAMQHYNASFVELAKYGPISFAIAATGGLGMVAKTVLWYIDCEASLYKIVILESFAL
jgi:hypothetical protein